MHAESGRCPSMDVLILVAEIIMPLVILFLTIYRRHGSVSGGPIENPV